MTELDGAAQGDEVVQRLVALLVIQRKESGGDSLQPPLKGRFLHGHMRATCNTCQRDTGSYFSVSFSLQMKLTFQAAAEEKSDG